MRLPDTIYITRLLLGAYPPGFTSGAIIDAIKDVASKTLPRGYDIAYRKEGLSYDEASRGNN